MARVKIGYKLGRADLIEMIRKLDLALRKMYPRDFSFSIEDHLKELDKSHVNLRGELIEYFGLEVGEIVFRYRSLEMEEIIQSYFREGQGRGMLFSRKILPLGIFGPGKSTPKEMQRIWNKVPKKVSEWLGKDIVMDMAWVWIKIEESRCKSNTRMFCKNPNDLRLLMFTSCALDFAASWLGGAWEIWLPRVSAQPTVKDEKESER